mgnify:CR=1 FL=1
MKKYLLTILFISVIVSVSHSKVVVFDQVTTVQTPIKIRVLTRGGFFSAGGRMVDIYLDNNLLKKILTGGDGYGYLKYTPRGPGLKKITARSNTDSASGRILVLNDNEKAIIIDTEGAFKDTVFSDEFRESSQKAVTSLSENYKIIYLSRVLGKGITGIWLEKQNFPKSVILRWRGPKTLENLKKNGVQVHAIFFQVLQRFRSVPAENDGFREVLFFQPASSDAFSQKPAQVDNFIILAECVDGLLATFPDFICK